LKFYIGVTDNAWFNFLAALRPDEVNFWQPGGSSNFRALSPGAPFLFKLHAPNNFIAGGGYFVKHSRVPLSIAWEAFGTKNGTSDFETFRTKIIQYRRRRGDLVEPDPVIGCIILVEPFFFARDNWLRPPKEFHPNTQQGKTFDTDEQIGRELWAQVEAQRKTDVISAGVSYVNDKGGNRYGAEYLVRPRLGQGSFRILVTDAYNRRCAMTGERTLPVLESVHIKPYALSGPHNVSNGLLLRSDLHKLFDLGYVTVTQDFHIEVSKRIKEEYENGRDYYALQGRSLISLPREPLYRPSQEYIDWHNSEIFRP
jgi:putative restriction endonuclease